MLSRIICRPVRESKRCIKHNHQRAVTETTARRGSFCFNQLTGVNLSAAARTRTLTRTSLIMPERGQMSGSAGTYPHGDRHFNVKGRGPVSISTDLIAVSVKHRWLNMSTSVECHCCTQSSVVKLGAGKSVRCLDHFRIPVANVLWPLTMARDINESVQIFYYCRTRVKNSCPPKRTHPPRGQGSCHSHESPVGKPLYSRIEI